jgi:hypothetical protein
MTVEKLLDSGHSVSWFDAFRYGSPSLTSTNHSNESAKELVVAALVPVPIRVSVTKFAQARFSLANVPQRGTFLSWFAEPALI